MLRSALFSLAVVAALGTGFTYSDPAERPEVPNAGNLSPYPLRIRDSVLRGERAERLARRTFDHGGQYRTQAGELVTIFLSDRYPPDDTIAQAWANTMGAMIHGAEIGSMTLYVAPFDEVRAICGQRAAACYGSSSRRLVVPGEIIGFSRTTIEDLATHEYGHHIALSRRNDPWDSFERGPKRWSSYESICQRAAAGAVFPGNEENHYTLNPGEGWAETYRWLNAERAGRADRIPWQIVDPTFMPDETALSLAELDVKQPWKPTVTKRSGRFSRKGAVVRLAVPVPFDGPVSIAIKGGGQTRVRLHDKGGKLLRTGVLRVDHVACGGRFFSATATATRAGRYTVTITTP